MWSNNPIVIICWYSDSWDNKVQYYKQSYSIINSKKIKYVHKHYPLSRSFSNKFTHNFALTPFFIFWLFSSDTIHVLVSVSPTVLELRFYGCCHPCLILFILLLFQGERGQWSVYYTSPQSFIIMFYYL
jgi:hypothetical protein